MSEENDARSAMGVLAGKTLLISTICDRRTRATSKSILLLAQVFVIPAIATHLEDPGTALEHSSAFIQQTFPGRLRNPKSYETQVDVVERLGIERKSFQTTSDP
jgi:hypothetical protein